MIKTEETIIALKATAFDISMEIQKLQMKFNETIQEITELTQELKTTPLTISVLKENESITSN